MTPLCQDCVALTPWRNGALCHAGWGSEMDPEERASSAFLIRVWRERREIPEDSPIWRGSIDDVDGGGRVYFMTLPELVDYVCSRAGMSAAPRRCHCCSVRRARRR